MLTTDLKYQLLQWLYAKYLVYPTRTWDIAPFLSEHGLSNEAEILDFGYAMKNTGLLKEYSGCTTNSFNAAISIKGIDFISDDIHLEMLHLLELLKQTANKRCSIIKHLSKFKPVYAIALDIALYMQSLGLVKSRVDGNDIIITLTAKGADWADPNSPDRAGTHHRMIA